MIPGIAGRKATPVSVKNLAIIIEERLKELETQYADESLPIPRPPHWGGIRIVPLKIEFWQGRPNRLHDRLLYQKTENNWQITRLSP